MNSVVIMSEKSKQYDFYTKFKNIFHVKKNILLFPTITQIRSIDKKIASFFERNSKTGGQGAGVPDFFYYNPVNNLIVVGENKPSTVNHGDEKYDVTKMTQLNKYAINDLVHYLTPFQNTTYKILGIAMSGDLDGIHLIDTFTIQENNIINREIDYLYDTEDEYLDLFHVYETEKAIKEISDAMKNVNNLLRDIIATDRPTLLAGIIISLYDKEVSGNINNLKKKNPTQAISSEIIKNLLLNDIKLVLENTNMKNSKKIDIVIKQVENSLNNQQLLSSESLSKLVEIIYPLMRILTKEYEFDVMATFYQEFLRYATGDGQDLGIVLTPQHITELMVELLDIFSGGISEKDVIFDPCLGTGTFLTTFMNFQINKFAKNDPHKQESIKINNLIGTEITEMMFTLAIANMLVRGDGKARIEHADFFLKEKDELELKPKFGIMNPPYSQSKKESGNNKSEMQFIERLLDFVDDGYVAVIVPKSTFFKNDGSYKPYREEIYKKHTLKAVIGMPNNLFQPSASTHTAIAVFKTDRKHLLDDEVYFYDLKYDGFDLSKNIRKDLRGKWKKQIFPKLIKDVRNRTVIESKSIVVKGLTSNDEWIPEAWIPSDFDTVLQNDTFFEKTIKEYMLFKYKEKTGILDLELNYINEKDPVLKDEIKEQIPTELDIIEQIGKEKISAYEIIGEDNE